MKEWQRPELTILVRNQPEEAVLSFCKTEGTNGPLPDDMGGEYWVCAPVDWSSPCYDDHPS